MFETEFDQLLAILYRCPGDDPAWTPLLQDVGRQFGVEELHLLVQRPDGTVDADVVTDRTRGSEYNTDYATRDLAVPAVLRSPPGRALWSHAIMRPEELARCPVLNELHLPRGIGSRSWVYTPFGPDQAFVTTLLHPRGQSGLSDRQSQALERLHTHMQQAMQLHLTLESARSDRQSLETGLAALDHGFVLLDARAHVLSANRLARILFQQKRLCLHKGQLMAGTPAEDARLQQLTANAVGLRGPSVAGSAVIQGLHLRAIPAAESTTAMPSRTAAVLLIRPPPALTIEPLIRAGLTPAEAALTVALAAGETPTGYAARTSRSIGTVRTQLRAIFSKTDTHRQSELVLFALRMAAS